MTDDGQPGKLDQDPGQEHELPQVRLQQTVQELKSRVSLQENQIHKLASTLNEIQGSRAWKLVQLLWRIRLTFVPNNSLRARLINRLLRRPELQPASLAPVGQVIIPSGTLPEQGISLQNKTVSPMTPVQTISFARDDNELTEGARGAEDRYAWPLISVILPVYNHADMLSQAAAACWRRLIPALS